jgi:tripartite-type tricarboxylate transporter receptor subunit TctC
MKKTIACILLAFCGLVTAQTKETITVVIPAAPTQSSTPLTLKVIDRANELQNRYLFVAEFKPGANGILALKYMDASPMTRIAGIAPAFIENAKSGSINESDYVPIHANGDVCWAVITNVGDGRRGIESLQALRGQEIVVGGVGYGNAAHITSLLLAEKYGFRVRYIIFKSNFDAVVNMVGNNGVNMALESINTYNQFKERQSKLQMLGYNCVARSGQALELRTLREQGINAPMIFNITMANRAMPEDRRREIGRILDEATQSIGAKEFAEVAGLYPAVFRNLSAENFAQRRIGLQKDLVKRFEKEIDDSKK